MQSRWCAVALAFVVQVVAGCGIGAGVVALHGSTTKYATFYNTTNCRDVVEGTTYMGQYVSHTTTVCDTVGPGETNAYNPNHLHFGALMGLKEGYASASYSTGGTGAMTQSASGQTIEPYFDFNVGFARYGGALEVGYAFHKLDDKADVSFGSVPITALGMMRLGPITTFAGLSLLTHTSVGDSTLGGFRLSGGLKFHAFSLFSDQIDVYPRVEVQSTHSSGDASAAYSATGVDLTLELGF